MPFAKEAFSTLGEVVIRDGRQITSADLVDAEALCIRSTTKVTRQLLEGTRIKFVGTATIGIDHMDIDYMNSVGIKWCYAPGCNANSVAEYVISALLAVAQRHNFVLKGKTLGIIGVGNVGSLVAKKARGLGLSVLLNDPPRQEREPHNVHIFTSLEKLLALADIVTLHVPLNRTGQYPTFHMANKNFFKQMKNGSIFINTSRGAVMDTDALINAIRDRIIKYAIIDTWENEPAYSDELLKLVDIGTPHIAGYSFEGKVNGTIAVYRELCKFLNVPEKWQFSEEASSSKENLFVLSPPDDSVMNKTTWEQTLIWETVRRVYDVTNDDRALRSCPDSSDVQIRAKHFDSLRKNYPVRREFHTLTVYLPGELSNLKDALLTLGFKVTVK
jgi:erythronate-4-phosphate dehydrogenase